MRAVRKFRHWLEAGGILIIAAFFILSAALSSSNIIPTLVWTWQQQQCAATNDTEGINLNLPASAKSIAAKAVFVAKAVGKSLDINPALVFGQMYQETSFDPNLSTGPKDHNLSGIKYYAGMKYHTTVGGKVGDGAGYYARFATLSDYADCIRDIIKRDLEGKKPKTALEYSTLLYKHGYFEGDRRLSEPQRIAAYAKGIEGGMALYKNMVKKSKDIAYQSSEPTKAEAIPNAISDSNVTISLASKKKTKATKVEKAKDSSKKFTKDEVESSKKEVQEAQKTIDKNQKPEKADDNAELQDACSADGDDTIVTGDWTWPFASIKGKPSYMDGGQFGVTSYGRGTTNFHDGFDFSFGMNGVKNGSTVLAVTDGVIYKTGNYGAAGYYIWQRAGEYNIIYQEGFENNNITVKAGQHVKVGQKIGVASGNHLHLGITTDSKNDMKKYGDPTFHGFDHPKEWLDPIKVISGSHGAKSKTQPTAYFDDRRHYYYQTVEA